MTLTNPNLPQGEGYASKFVNLWLQKYTAGDDDAKNHLLLEIAEEASSDLKVLKKLKQKHQDILLLNYINMEAGEETTVADLIEQKSKEKNKVLVEKIGKAKQQQSTPSQASDTNAFAGLLKIRGELPKGEEIIEETLEEIYENAQEEEYYYQPEKIKKPIITLESADRNSAEDLKFLYPNITFQTQTRIPETHSEQYSDMTLEMLEQDEEKLEDDTIFKVPGILVDESSEPEKIAVMQAYPNIDVRVLAKQMGYEIVINPVYRHFTTYTNRERGFGIDEEDNIVVDYYSTDYLKDSIKAYSSRYINEPPEDVVKKAENLQIRLDAKKEGIELTPITKWLRNLQELPQAFSKVTVYKTSEIPTYSIIFSFEEYCFEEKRGRMGIKMEKNEFLGKTNLTKDMYIHNSEMSFAEQATTSFKEILELEWYGKSLDGRERLETVEWYKKYKEKLNSEFETSSFYVSSEGKLMFKSDKNSESIGQEVGAVRSDSQNLNYWIIDTVGEKSKWDRRHEYKFYSDEKEQEPEYNPSSRMRRR